MKRMILVLVVGLAMFGASAGLSWYLRHAELAHTGEATEAEGGHASDRVRLASDVGSRALSKMPAALDPQGPPSARATTPSAESVAQLAATLRQQQETVRTREQNLVIRQKHLEVIYLDLKNERKVLDDLRQQITDEMKALTEKMDAMDKKGTELDKKKQDLNKQSQDVKQTIFEVETLEQKNIKKMAETFNAMDAATSAELLQQMADGGKMEMAAKVLATMQERQAARVFSEMEDRGTVVQLLDKMKGLKRPNTVP
jgi:flagellar motility protein MotE (MotC chaperone)